MKAPTEETLRAILARIDTDDDDEAIAAMRELVDRVPLVSPAPVALLLEATSHTRARVRQAGVRGLGLAVEMTNEERASCRARLLALTRDEASMVVASACEAIGAFANEDHEAIGARLLELLADPQTGVVTRENAIASLGRIYSDAGGAVPGEVREAVRKATRHASPEVASMARWASTRFDEAATRRPLEEEEDAPMSLEDAEARLRKIDGETRRTSRLFYGSMAAIVIAIAVAPMFRAVSGAVALVAVALLVSWSGARRRAAPPETRIRAQLAVTRARLEKKADDA